MSLVSRRALVDLLLNQRFLPREQVAVLLRLVRENNGPPQSLARALVQHGLLTVFQINQLLAGQGRDLVVGPYRLLDRLGQGGLSQVFKARHTESEEVVALKVVRHDLSANLEARRQLRQEETALSCLSHPNIVGFVEVGETMDVSFCALEFVAGTDLNKLVDLSGPLSVRRACVFIGQAALALQHAHERGLIHRDIKPANLILADRASGDTVLFGDDGTVGGESVQAVKLVDWGLSTTRPDAEGVCKHNQGLMGTPDYLSPELGWNASAVDIRGDIYSLGCTFYYLLAGKPPFPGGSLMKKLLQHRDNEAPALEGQRSDLPAALPAIVRRMMAKQPANRFQTPGEVACALSRWCDLDESGLHSASQETVGSCAG
jgi:eukaryotic-like serine/threonine-protein kinase